MKQQAFCTVLVVDDSPEDREMCSTYLRRAKTCSYSIVEAADVKTGLDLCRQVQVDCILLDYQMPDRDGLEFLRLLCREYGDAHPPVVMLTGRGSAGVAVAAMKAGAIDYLPKEELSAESLYRVTQNALEKLQVNHELAGRKLEIGSLQKELQEREARHRALVESMTEHAILMLDGEGHVQSWNAGARHLFDIHDHEILGRPFKHLFADLEDQETINKLALARANPPTFEVKTCKMTRKDGTSFAARCVIYPICAEQGQIDGFSLLIHGLDGEQANSPRGLEGELSALAQRAKGAGVTVASMPGNAK